MALLGLIRTMHAITVHGAGFQVRHEDVPDLVGIFGQFNAFDFMLTGFIEQTQFDLGRVR